MIDFPDLVLDDENENKNEETVYELGGELNYV